MCAVRRPEPTGSKESTERTSALERTAEHRARTPSSHERRINSCPENSLDCLLLSHCCSASWPRPACLRAERRSRFAPCLTWKGRRPQDQALPACNLALAAADGRGRTPNRGRYLRTRDVAFRLHVLKQWRRRAIRAGEGAQPAARAPLALPPAARGPWRDAHDPYWGGLSDGPTLSCSTTPRAISSRRGWANTWSPVEQMWVAEQAHRAGGASTLAQHRPVCGLL